MNLIISPFFKPILEADLADFDDSFLTYIERDSETEEEKENRILGVALQKAASEMLLQVLPKLNLIEIDESDAAKCGTGDYLDTATNEMWQIKIASKNEVKNIEYFNSVLLPIKSQQLLNKNIEDYAELPEIHRQVRSQDYYACFWLDKDTQRLWLWGIYDSKSACKIATYIMVKNEIKIQLQDFSIKEYKNEKSY